MVSLFLHCDGFCFANLTSCCRHVIFAAATLEYSPGTAVEIFVTFLTAPQLQRMHETEGAYFLTELRQVQLHLGLSLEAYRQAPLMPAAADIRKSCYSHIVSLRNL